MQEAEKEMARQYYRELLEKENVIMAVSTSLLGALPAAAMIYLLGAEGRIPLVLLLLPGVIIGLFARYGGGNAFRTSVQIIPAAVTVLVMFGAWFIQHYSIMVLIMAIPGAIFAYLIGKPSLTERQSLAKHRVERGLVRLDVD